VWWTLASRRWRPYIEEHSANDNGPTALLRDLILWLEGDAMDLYFSWQALQDQCAKVWHHLERSLSTDPSWDSKWSQDPRMGIYILEGAAADEEHWGRIAKDDKAFASPLRKAHDAIQKVILEVQPEPQTALGIFDKDPRMLDDCATHGGEVCLARLAKENKTFVTSIFGGDHLLFLDFYKNWPELAKEKFVYSNVVQSVANFGRDMKEAEEKKAAESTRFYDPEDGKYYRIQDHTLVSDDEDDDPCADCPRCKRRKFLGHRYPTYAGHYGEVDRELWDEDSERSTDSEDEGV